MSEENQLQDDRLPLRLFATDRYPTCRLNVYSKPDTLTVLRHILRDSAELQQILNSSFGSLFDLPANRSPISCKLIQALLARQLVTKQKYEMWTVFGGQPLRFSLNEFHSITGLNCELFEEGYDTPTSEGVLKEPDIYWKRWIGDDVKTTCADIATWLRDDKEMDSDRRIRLALLLIVDCVLIANHQTHTLTPRYVKMVDNPDAFLSFPGGREAFIKTLSSMRPSRSQLCKSKEGPVSLFCKQLQQKSIKLNGFPLALQLLAFRAIPALLEKLPDPADRPRIIDLTSSGFPNNSVVTLNDVLDAEIDCNLVVNPIIDPSPNRGVGVGEWDDEIRDRKVEYMVDLIKDNHVFVKEEWPGGDHSCPLIVHQPFSPQAGHKRHILNRKKGKATSKTVVCGLPKPQVTSSKSKESRAYVKNFLDQLPDAPSDQLFWLANHLADISYKVHSLQSVPQATPKRTRSQQKKPASSGRSSKRRRVSTPIPQSSSTSTKEAAIRLAGDHQLDSSKDQSEDDIHPPTHVHH
ncbi:hypothetical protein EUTSA_v10029293mg, partial [Eutrema salsugineum]